MTGRAGAGAPVAHLSASEACALALRAQGFGEVSGVEPIGVLRRLGVIQLDSVTAVARSQDLVPFARLGPCSAEAMRRAVYEERRGFEYWGHAASWLPVDEYRYFRFRMARFRERHRAYREAHRDLLAHVLDRVRAEGPLGTAAFEDPRPERGSWWDWKPAKEALEVLFAGGELTCAGRTAGFARLYDLPERVLPPGLDTADPGVRESARHLLRRSVAALGVATTADAADYFRLLPRDVRQDVDALLAAGELARVAVEGWTVPGLVAPGALDAPGALEVPAHPPAFLSPFDNLIWNRARTERLFGFRFRIELYTPQAQRPFGYYVLPLLARGTIAGKADVKLERGAGVLRLRRLRLEGAAPEEAGEAAGRLAAHLGAGEVRVDRAEPEGVLEAVLEAVQACRY